MKGTGAAWIVSGLLLAGCSTAPAPDEAPPPPPSIKNAPEDSCGAQAVGSITGQILDDETRTWIEDRSRAGSIRVMEPGKGYTMDYRADRLDIKVDDQNRIIDITCG